MNQVKENDQLYIAHTYARFDVELTHGLGAIVYDDAEKAYIDLTAGIGVNALGFANEEWVNAITEQATKLSHVSNLYYSKPDTEVAKILCTKTGFKKMIFSNSGAEANEGAIKVARKYSYDKYGEGRNEIITLVNSFHGRTITTLAATGQDSFHQYFYPFTQGFRYAIANDIHDMSAKVNDHTCAIMIEMIQGEGGVLPLDTSFVKEVARLCKKMDILLIVDEVQTGIGRCGSLYAYEQYGIHPDIVTTAKGLGNGLPIGGVLLGEKCQNTLGYGDHGTTFGGNPIACAGALVVLTYMEPSFFKQIQEKSAYIKNRFLQMPHVLEVNGMGFMMGIVLDRIDSKEVVKACIQKGVLILTAKNNLRLLPPLVISQTEIEQAMDIIENVLTTWEE